MKQSILNREQLARMLKQQNSQERQEVKMDTRIVQSKGILKVQEKTYQSYPMTIKILILFNIFSLQTTLLEFHEKKNSTH